MVTIANNPYEYESQELDRQFRSPSSISDTQQAISRHLKSSGRGVGMAHAVAVDIDKLKSPFTQNTIDISHRFGSWNEFTESNPVLSNLGESTSTALNNYQTNFTRCMYAPLSSLLSHSNQPYLLAGNPNLLLQQVSDVYNHLKWSMSSNRCLQICVRSQHSFQNGPRFHHKPRFAAKEARYKDFDNLGHRLRECIAGFDDSSCCYQRYEILTDGTQFQIFEAKNNNTIPKCSLQHPLCKIYNATQSILPNNELKANEPGLISFIFLVDYDCIRVYLLFSDGAQLYGTRIFKPDLINTVPKLFANQQLFPMTQSQLDTVQFIVDRIYNEYYKHLRGDIDIDDDEKEKSVDSKAGAVSLVDKLPLAGNNWNIHNLVYMKNIDSSQIAKCLDDNNIDAAYFREHTREEFCQLLKMSCNVKAGVATTLWRYLGGFDQDCHRNHDVQQKDISMDEKVETDIHVEDEELDEDGLFPPSDWSDDDEEAVQDQQSNYTYQVYEQEQVYYPDDVWYGVASDYINNAEHKEDMEMDVIMNYDTGYLSVQTDWSDDEDEEAEPEEHFMGYDSDADNDEDQQPPVADHYFGDESYDDYNADGLSLPSYWTDQDEDEDEDGDEEEDEEYYDAEVLSVQSDFDTLEYDTYDLNNLDSGFTTIAFIDPNHLHLFNLMFGEAMVNFLVSYNHLFDYLIVRYLFFDIFRVVNFYPRQKFL